MGSIKEFFNNMFGAAGVVVMYVLFLGIPIGELYWLWMAIKLGSFWMFVVGLLGPMIFIASPIGLYSLIFGIPRWIFSTFG